MDQLLPMHALNMPLDEIADAIDQRIVMRASWETYEVLLAERGEKPRPRFIYFDGMLEIMTTSFSHELIKKTMSRILEAWSLDRDVDLRGGGGPTLMKKRKKSGIEPDECYSLGRRPALPPDLALEVVWTHGGIDKLLPYGRLGVGEVWFWKDEKIEVYVLGAGGYRRSAKSRLLPDFDLPLLAELSMRDDQNQAIREFLKRATRKKRARSRARSR